MGADGAADHFKAVPCASKVKNFVADSRALLAAAENVEDAAAHLACVA
jgi:hypothetical protein